MGPKAELRHNVCAIVASGVAACPVTTCGSIIEFAKTWCMCCSSRARRLYPLDDENERGILAAKNQRAVTSCGVIGAIPPRVMAAAPPMVLREVPKGW